MTLQPPEMNYRRPKILIFPKYDIFSYGFGLSTKSFIRILDKIPNLAFTYLSFKINYASFQCFTGSIADKQELK